MLTKCLIIPCLFVRKVIYNYISYDNDKNTPGRDMIPAYYIQLFIYNLCGFQFE